MKAVSGQRSVVSSSIILVTLCALLLTLCASAEAQQGGKVYRIGWLTGGVSRRIFSYEAVRRELRELGYAEGKNIVFEFRYAEGKPENSPALADDLVRLRVDVIVCGGGNDTQAAKNATKTIPIVFLESVADPVAIGVVKSLARPGGNITGFTTMASVLAGKRLELLKESIPKLSRVAVLWNSQAADGGPQWKESQQVAQRLGLQVYSMEASNPGKYDTAFKEAIKAGSGALAITRHRLSVSYQKPIIELALRHRLPAIHFREDFVEQGGLMSYGADEFEPFKRVAAMIDKILKGAKPADLPVEQPTKFELVINLKTAKQIGLTIPPNVLARADRVIR
ncbi:MAG TPA: ABC transporter substrate-binding protein [Candidatus Binatia bacterium]|jgi:putative ABC transport system substrate-binding protein